ncbi:Aldo/keto reductase [Agrocybe pediades]|nr:Aldo/keto reductase [Agrocybe pediades]
MPQLPTRKIGNDDVTAIGFGLMGLSVFYGAVEGDEERMKVLDAAFNLGCTNWDTSDFYGDNEDLLCKWFKRTGNRNKIFLATKFGLTGTGTNGSPEYVKSSVEKALKRMNIDHIDLLYVHSIDPTVPIEKTISAMADFVKQGKVRYLGLCEVGVSTLRRAHAVHPISAVQIEHSLISLETEPQKTELLNACRELGITIVAYSPTGRGMLSGAYKSHDDIPKDDFRSSIPKFGPDNFHHVLNLSNALAEVGKKHNATPTQIALAWLLADADDVIPIPGTKKIKYLEENLGALNIKLDPKEVEEIRELAKRADDGKSRYPEWVLPSLWRDTIEFEEST